MNKQRRKELQKAMEGLENIKADIEGLLDEEQEYLDNMPDSLVDGEKGEVAQEAIDNMQSAIDSLDEAITSLEEAQN